MDYYLSDGKARLEQAHRDLMAVLGARDSAREGATASAVGDGLAALYRALNEHDPLYRYAFAVGAASDRDAAVPRDPPGSLLFTAQVTKDDVCVTWSVHAWCDEAVRERPIPIGLRFDASADPGLRESLRLFAEYGRPFDAPQGTATVSMDLPGGFGGTPQSGSIRIGPTREDAARRYVLRLRATRPRAQPVTVRLAMNAPTVGSRGARLAGRHDGGAFSFEALHDFEPAAMRVRFTAHDLSGEPVAAVIDGVEFMLALRAAAVEVAAEHGPFLPLGDRIDDDIVDDGSGDREIAAFRALNEIQQHTVTTVLVPDLAETTVRQAREWELLARILRGETVTDRWLGELTSELEQPPAESLEGDGAFTFTTELVAEVGAQRLLLGRQTWHVDAAAVRTDPDTPTRLSVTPVRGHSWTRTRAAA